MLNFPAKFLFVFALLFSVAEVHANRCAEALSGKSALEVGFGELRLDFKHTTKYDVELLSPFPVKNQCATSFCHLYAWSAELENPAKIETSTEYVSAVYLIAAAEKALLNGDVSFAGKLGAGPVDSLAGIRKAGLIPKEVWKGTPNFNTEPSMSKLLGAIQNIIARAVAARSSTKDVNLQIQISNEAYAEIHDVFKAAIGEIPKTFEYRGEIHTPLTFADKYFPELSNPIVRLYNARDKGEPPIGRTNHEGTEIFTNMDELQRTARQVLDNGHPIWLAYQHTHQYVDIKSGIMSIDAFNYPPMAKPVPWKIREAMKMFEGMHAVLLTGYELDPMTGKVKKWKIQNSWGAKAGDGGIFHMYDDYFRQFVVNITYLNNGKFPIPEHFEFRPDQGFPLK